MCKRMIESNFWEFKQLHSDGDGDGDGRDNADFTFFPPFFWGGGGGGRTRYLTLTVPQSLHSGV